LAASDEALVIELLPTAGGVNFYIEAHPHDLGAERGFLRPADIAKTDEQHGRFSGHVLRSSVIFERYDISDPRA
jgi:hypothetical protein